MEYESLSQYMCSESVSEFNAAIEAVEGIMRDCEYPYQQAIVTWIEQEWITDDKLIDLVYDHFE